MKTRLVLLTFAIGFTAVGASRVFAAETPWKLPAEETRLKPGAGAELVKANCLLCHSTDYITTQPALTRDQWKATVVKMQQKFGAPFNAEKLDPQLVEYLVKGYGK